MKREHKKVEVKIEYYNERGYGVGFLENGRVVNVLNAIPGEIVIAEIFKRRKGVFVGNAITIIEPSPQRIEPLEKHFLSTSPLQIISLDYEQEVKKDLIKGFYKEQADITLAEFDITLPKKEYGYRNKVEFSFYGDESGVRIAYRMRENGFFKIPIERCMLMPDEVNEVARKVVEIINANKVEARSLKGLLVRYSFYEKKCVACLYCKDEGITLDFEFDQKFQEICKSFTLFYSTPKSPANVETSLIKRYGEDTDLIEEIGGLKFKYPWNSFFQINPPEFSQALNDITEFFKDLEGSKDVKVLDMYAGVGVIGIGVQGYVKEVMGVELFEGSKEYATFNSKQNYPDKSNYNFVVAESEKEGLNYIDSYDVIIVDPPRIGMHPKVVQKLLDSKPKYLIYLSCNPKTQAENFKLLKDFYEIKFFKAYNFYPKTPHVESLMICELK